MPLIFDLLNNENATKMKSANDNYRHATGGDDYYKISSFSRIVASDGAYLLCQESKSMWMFDVMTSHQFSAKVRMQEFQVWTFTRKGRTNQFRAPCEDGNGNKVVAQIIPFSDFEYDVVTFWLENGVIYLPSEH